MASGKPKHRIHPKTFADEYARGLSEEELMERFSISRANLSKLVIILKGRGDIDQEILERRRENMRIRFGSETGPRSSKVIAVDLNTGLALHCPACGAAIKRNTEECQYCSAPLDFSLTGKTTTCPKCFSETPAEGNFCYRCAEPIAGRIKEGLILHDRICPHCEKPMRGMHIGRFSIADCKDCGGAFIPHNVFEVMQAQADKLILPTAPIERRKLTANQPVRYLRCPTCRKMMNRTNFGRISGIIVDACGKHGIWFEPGEIQLVLEFIAKGGIRKSKEYELQRLKDEQKLAQLRATPIISQPGGSWPYDHESGAHALSRLVSLFFR